MILRDFDSRAVYAAFLVENLICFLFFFFQNKSLEQIYKDENSIKLDVDTELMFKVKKILLLNICLINMKRI